MLAAIFYSAIDWRAQCVCALILFVDLGVSLHRHRRLRGCLIWRMGSWLWIDRDGGETVFELRSSTLWPGLIVLRFRIATSGKIRTFTLLHDSLDADMQRRLRAYLRHMPVFPDAGVAGAEAGGADS